jgi:hypothetical protein
MPLTESQAKNSKPREQAYKLADAGGLFLLVQPNGARLWRMKYRYGGKEKLLSFGAYPDVGIAAARDKRTVAKAILAEGRDPMKNKSEIDPSKSEAFRVIAERWHENRKSALVPAHADRVWSRLERDVFPRGGRLGLAAERRDRGLDRFEVEGKRRGWDEGRGDIDRCAVFAKSTGSRHQGLEVRMSIGLLNSFVVLNGFACAAGLVLERLAQRAHRALGFGRLAAAQFARPARGFDHGPGDRFLMERARWIDMGREHDAQGALAGPGIVGGDHAPRRFEALRNLPADE